MGCLMGTRRSLDSPCVGSGAYGEVSIRRVLSVHRVFSSRRTAKILFTVCPRKSTQQTLRHRANSRFPAVNSHILGRRPRRCNWKVSSSSRNRSREILALTACARSEPSLRAALGSPRRASAPYARQIIIAISLKILMQFGRPWQSLFTYGSLATRPRPPT